MDLNKKVLTQTKDYHSMKAYTPYIGLVSAKTKIIHIGIFLRSKMGLNANTVKLFLYQYSVKITFWKIYVVGLNLGDFNFCCF